MVMEIGEKGKGELVWFSPERSSQCEGFGIQEKQKELTL